jgi:hypothetical protein
MGLHGLLENPFFVFSSLFDDADGNCVVSDDSSTVNTELERMWKEAIFT